MATRERGPGGWKWKSCAWLNYRPIERRIALNVSSVWRLLAFDRSAATSASRNILRSNGYIDQINVSRVDALVCIPSL